MLTLFLHKKMVQGQIGDVQYANGIIQFQAVKLNVHAFVIDGIAIDTGAHSLVKQFLQFFSTQSVNAVYCTHVHEDHTGCAAALQKQYDLPIYLDGLSVGEARKKGKYPLYRQLFWGRRKAFIASPLPETFQSRTFEWRSIFTPGHAADHTAFLNTSTGQLFSGDLFIQARTKVIMDTESIPQIIRSLEHVLSYDFEEVFCSHAGHLPNGKEQLRAKRDYLCSLTEEVTDLHEKGLTNKEIEHKLFPRVYPITRFSSGQWHTKHIITSILGEK
ncbi:MBL fold metallo-hydrolase [Shouchella lonarensis]|uniref:MBL fold metallo-hydrolase n=1 Tax=Shouchella lonarensis TaxID=1464122 RepID=UPI003461B3F8